MNDEKLFKIVQYVARKHGLDDEEQDLLTAVIKGYTGDQLIGQLQMPRSRIYVNTKSLNDKLGINTDKFKAIYIYTFMFNITLNLVEKWKDELDGISNNK